MSLTTVSGERELYTFDEFTLDVAERRLTRRSAPVATLPKAFNLLVVLVRQAGRLVTKAQLLAAVWPNVFVGEGILAVHVSQLRKALGDDKRAPRYIETVSGFGYRFIAPVTTPTTESAASDEGNQHRASRCDCRSCGMRGRSTP